MEPSLDSSPGTVNKASLSHLLRQRFWEQTKLLTGCGKFFLQLPAMYSDNSSQHFQEELAVGGHRGQEWTWHRGQGQLPGLAAPLLSRGDGHLWPTHTEMTKVAPLPAAWCPQREDVGPAGNLFSQNNPQGSHFLLWSGPKSRFSIQQVWSLNPGTVMSRCGEIKESAKYSLSACQLDSRQEEGPVVSDWVVTLPAEKCTGGRYGGVQSRATWPVRKGGGSGKSRLYRSDAW